MRKFSKIESELLLKEELTVGIDEVGRGSLIGPVVACAFQLDSIIKNIELNDSKMLSENKRISKVLELLINNSVFALGYSSNEEIDEINILNATKLAMKRAVKNLNAKPATLLIDGNHDIGTGLKEICIIKGDKTCKSIAAASIIAKFTRDFILKKISRIYPYYRLEKNKGYGTQEHVDSLRKYGPSPFHRKTFRIKQN
jgi:ribonuclease HII